MRRATMTAIASSVARSSERRRRPPREPPDRDDRPGRVGGRDGDECREGPGQRLTRQRAGEHRGVGARHDVRAEVRRVSGRGPLTPRDEGGVESRTEFLAHGGQQRLDVVGRLQEARDRGAQGRVVRPVEHDRIDEPRRDPPQPRIEQGRGHPQRHQNADLPRVDFQELRERPGPGAERCDRRECDGRQRKEREGALEEQVGQRERIVLVQDREGERQRRVVSQELHGPRGGAVVQLAQVQGRDGEDGERGHPQGASRARLAARHRCQRDDEREERVGEQAHAGRGGHDGFDPCGVQVEQEAGGARRIGGGDERAPDEALDGLGLAAEHRMDHDGRQEAEGAEADRHEVRERALDAHLGQLVDGQRAEIPDQAEQRGRQQQGIERRCDARRPPGADHHDEQHGVGRDAGAQSDQVQQFADVHGA